MKKFGLCLLFLVCLSSNAADWKHVASANGQDILIDTSSIIRVNTLVRAWSMINFATPDYVPDQSFQYLSDKSLFFYDCNNKKFGRSTQILYADKNGMGQSVVTFSVTTRNITYEKITPNTVSETMLNFVCAHIPVSSIRR